MQAYTPLAKLNRLARARLSKRSALVAVLAVGCVAAPGFALAKGTSAAGMSDAAGLNKKLEKQLVTAERAVAKQPQSLEARARLAQGYLAAGRFASAAATFEDAVSLGDRTPTTALGMALAYIGANRNAEAMTLLGQWRDSLPAGDYGLALALAGDPAEAVNVLSAQIKQGENTAKNRQNLAYAYAMGGRLAEARVIASQDVPVDQLDARVSDWALQASVGSQQSRVAALLGAPVRSDPGQPAQLALSAVPERTAMAVNSVQAPAAPATQELPALAPDATPAPVLAQTLPATAPVALAVAEPAPAVQEIAASAPMLADASGMRFVSNPVIQPIPTSEPAPVRLTPRAPARTLAITERPVSQRVAAARPSEATHVVQLGSFTTEEGAHRAWGIFQRRDPSLKDHELQITRAVVNGRAYWRVAAAGYDMASARAKCSTARGGGCLAYASGRKVPTAVAAVAQRLAQR